MKKRRKSLAKLLPFLLSLLLITGTIPIYAADATPADSQVPPTTTEPESEDLPSDPTNTVSLIGAEIIRPGETVEFSFLCDASNIRAIQGSLIYDPTLLTYVGSNSLLDDWKITFSQEEGKLKYLGLSTENRPALGNSPLFSATFQVNEAATVDSLLSFTVSDTTAYDGNSEITLAGGDFSFPVSRALSNECTLTSLSIKGGNLSPAFSPEITEYSVKLPYTAHLAEITATACEYGKLKYSSRDLSIGDNLITITVISETGLQQVYKINVNRAEDPNYTPSSDNRVLKMNLSDGLLFPSFSPEITEYTVYLVNGYDVFIIPTVAPKAVADGLFIQAIPAPGSTEEQPTAGTYTIICYAEDGTPRTYTFKTILLSSPQQLEEIRKQNENPNYVVPLIIFIVSFVCIVIFFIGFVMGNVLRSKKKKDKSPSSSVELPPITPAESSSEEAPLASETPKEPTLEESPETPPTDFPAPTEEPSQEPPVQEESKETPVKTDSPSKKNKKKKKKKH